jgi:predicted Zn-dependent protease
MFAMSLMLLSGCSYNGPSKETLSLYITAKESYQKGFLPQAEKSLSAILKKDPQFHQASLLYGKVLLFDKKAKDAKSVFERLISRYPGYNEARIWLVRSEIEMGLRKEAKKHLTDFLAFDPQDPRLLFMYAQLALLENDYKTGLEYLNKAAVFKEEYAKVHLELGKVYNQFGLTERALAELAFTDNLLSDDSLLKKPVKALIEKIRAEEKTGANK